MLFSPIIIAMIILFRLLAAGSKIAKRKPANKWLRKLRIRKADGLLGNNFIDSRQLFVKLNRQLPNVMLINGIDVNRAVTLIEETLNGNIKAMYKHNQFDFDERRALFNMIVVVTNNNRIIEIGNGYVELQYTMDGTLWADSLVKDMAQFQLQAPVKAATRNICITGFAGEMN